HDLQPLLVRNRSSGRLFDRGQYALGRRFLEALADPAEAHVRQVLDPLEVRYGDAAGIQVDVRNNQHTAVEENLFRLARRRAVRRLGDDLRPDLRRIVAGDLALEGGRDQDVAVRFKGRVRGRDVPGTREIHDRLRFLLELENRVDVEPGLTVDAALAL